MSGMMPRFYKPKLGALRRRHIDEELMVRAVGDVVRGIPVKTVARLYDLNFMTLKRYHKKLVSEGPSSGMTSNYRKSQIFTAQEEEMLREYIEFFVKLHHGLSVCNIQQLAYQFAKAHDVTFPTSWEKNQKAGYDWYRSYMARHSDLKLKPPETNVFSLGTKFNAQNVQQFFNLLCKIEKDEMEPDFVWNTDDSD